MNNRDLFSMALRNLFKRKLRTFLTILGVVVGTAAIVVMISLGLAMNQTFAEQLASLGDITVVTVYSPGTYGPPQTSDPQEYKRLKDLKLDDNAIEGFRQMPGVVAATPVAQVNLNFKSGRYVADNLTIIGIQPEAMEALGYVAAEGRLLLNTDRTDGVFGSQVATNFYRQNANLNNGTPTGGANINPMKDKLQFSYDWRLIHPDNSPASSNQPEMKIYNMKGVGVLEPKNDYSADYSIYMNITEVQKLQKAQQQFYQSQSQQWTGSKSPGAAGTGYERALVKCADLNMVKKTKAALEKLGYPAEIPSQQLDAMQQTSNSLQALLGAIGAVSLLVAAIGIANTMVMAIYERTKEIGIMKVVGALVGDIKRLFLLEAGIIGFLGGIFGILLSLLISYLLNVTGFSFMTMNQYNMSATQSSVSLITPWLCGMALAFATVIGILSGYFPAVRATKISALTAIRTE